MDNKEIILTKEHRGGISSSTFSGRPQGEAVRKILDLENKDKDNNIYLVKLPDDTTSFNPSFYLGLFYPSIKALKGVDNFKNKYRIDLKNIEPEELRHLVLDNIAECERKANNEYSGRTGLDL